jgi:hypothetical protein
LYVQPANELNIAPRGFEGSSKKDTMPEQMRKLFRWYKYMSDILEAEGFPRDQIIGNTEDNKNYPKAPSNAEAVIAGIRGMKSLGGGGKGKLEAQQVICAWHKVLFPEDIPGRIYRALRLEIHFCSDDGKSLSGKKGSGYWVINKDGKKVYQSTNTIELYNITKAMMELAKNGVKHKNGIHKVHIVYFMLPREKTVYNKKKGKWTFDLNRLDWDRMAVMPKAYKDVFGKYPEGYGKYPKIEEKPKPKPPEPIEPIKPVEQIKPEEVSMKKEVRNNLNEMWFKLFRGHFKTFWQEGVWEQKASAVSILMILIFLIWALVIIF